MFDHSLESSRRETVPMNGHNIEIRVSFGSKLFDTQLMELTKVGGSVLSLSLRKTGLAVKGLCSPDK